MRDPGDDSRLIEGLKAGKSDSFATFVETFSPAIFRLARLKLGNAAAAEDASQVVFLKAFMKIHTLNSERLFSWVLKIARNHCFDILRKRTKTPEMLVDFSADAMENVVAEMAPSALLSRDTPASGEEMPDFLQELNETAREIVLLRVIEELDYREIAEITGMVEGSVRNVFSKAMRSLREGAESNEM